jgi:hypothetical protein
MMREGEGTGRPLSLRRLLAIASASALPPPPCPPPWYVPALPLSPVLLPLPLSLPPALFVFISESHDHSRIWHSSRF